MKIRFAMFLLRALFTHRYTTALFCAACFSFVLLGEAEAAGSCWGKSNSANECQYIAPSLTTAPDPSVSKGIRLNAGVGNVLFNTYSPAYIISNSGSEDLFIPQGTEAEFSAFIDSIKTASLNAVSLKNAILPATATATPGSYETCVLSPSTQQISVPQTLSSISPVTVDGYMAIDAASVYTSGMPTTYVGPLVFSQTRTDCSTDNQSNRECNSAFYKNTQTLLFTATGTGGSFNWNTSSPNVINGLSLSVNNGTATSVADCSTTQAPILKAKCGPNDGSVLGAIPTTGLCTTGDASAVATYTTSYGYKWGWTCNDVQGAVGGPENVALTSGVGCAACQDKAKQTISACSLSCGGGTQTVTWYDGCGNIELQYAQSCNTQTCFSGGSDVYTSMRPYGYLTQSDVYSYGGGAATYVTVSGPGSPSLRINGGAWVSGGTIYPGQTVQLQAYAPFADAATETITLSTGASVVRWHVSTANATLIYATYWGSGPNNCTSGHGNMCSNYYSCGSNMITCRVGTNCSNFMHTPNPGECNCNDNYYWYVSTAAGSSGAWATFQNRCGSTNSYTNPGFAPYPGTGTMSGMIGMLLL